MCLSKSGKAKPYNVSRVYCSKRRDHNGSFQSQHFLHGCTRKFTSNSYFLLTTLAGHDLVIEGLYSFRRKSGRPRYSSRQDDDIADAQEQFESMSFYTIAVQYTVDSMNGTPDTRDELFATLDIMLQHRPSSHTLRVN